MKNRIIISLLVLMAICGCHQNNSDNKEQPTPPHLERRGDVTQLIVKGEPWLVLGCELGNSTSSSREYLAPYWQQLKDAGVMVVRSQEAESAQPVILPDATLTDGISIDDLRREVQQRQYVPNGKFLAWCMRIAHNVMMDIYRDNRLQNIVETPDDNDMSKIRDEYVVFDNAENTIVRGQVMSDVKKMVNLLPPTQREVVYMRYYQQLSFKEIAELTNVSINTSLGRMRYALLNLRRMAKEHDVFSNITMF